MCGHYRDRDALRVGKLRTFLADNGIGYVMRVGCAFTIETRPGQRIQARVKTLCWTRTSTSKARSRRSCRPRRAGFRIRA
jgi:hypothetical protein